MDSSRAARPSWLTPEQEKQAEEYRQRVNTIPRWAKAFLGARAARRAIETLDSRLLKPDFKAVLDTLARIDAAIERGVEIDWHTRQMSPAREYADRTGVHNLRPSDSFAALAVDDAFAFITQEGRLGRHGAGTMEEFHARKLSFAQNSAVRAVENSGEGFKLKRELEKDMHRVIEAVSTSGPWDHSRPVPKDFLAHYTEFDTEQSVAGSSIIEICAEISDELIARLREAPTMLYGMDPRRFEELIARIFESFGFAVELTAQSRDGGRDIIAIKHEPARTKFLIECKRYAKENKVGIDIVQRLHGVINGEPATCGIIATTSSFSHPATEFLQRPMVEYRLTGRDFDGLTQWLATWEQNRRIRSLIGPEFTVLQSGLVVPSRYV